MRSSLRSLRFVLGSVLCLAIAWPLSAATGAYIKIEGTKQGQFKGEEVRQGSKQWIPVISVNYQVESPRDSATGQSSGKRQHHPVRITMEQSAVSAQLKKALQTNEHLREVVIEFVRAGAQGKEQVYQTITLTDATIATIEAVHGSNAKNGHEGEAVSFAYEKIQVTHAQGNKTAKDNWTAQ
jgi:type VI secretion system secreted protein Hcp